MSDQDGNNNNLTLRENLVSFYHSLGYIYIYIYMYVYMYVYLFRDPNIFQNIDNYETIH